MKNLIPRRLTPLFFFFSILGNAQSTISDDFKIQKAQQRYPMLEVCQPEGLQEKILCGTLMVYENRETLQGKKIPIDVRILPSLEPNPPKKAYLMHPGGPGGTTNSFMFYLFGENGPDYNIRAERDVIVMDFRGMGASAINCDAISSIRPMSNGFVYDIEKIKACLDALKDKVDLTQYNTGNVVDDIEEIRNWLGIEKLDIRGGSYGVRVALEYSRRYTDQVNSLILSGIVPPNYDYVNRMDKAVEKQIKRLINECNSDSICNTYYPNFEKELYETRERLKKVPKKLIYEADSLATELVINDKTYRQMVGHLFLSGNKDDIIPMVVHEAYEGNFYPLINSGSFNLSMPMFLSAFCPEEINRVVYRKRETDSLFTEGAIAEEKEEACSQWLTLNNADWLEEPLKAAVPILLFTGENDANTPMVLGESIATRFPDTSRHLVIPYQGHSSSSMASACRSGIISEFIKTGDLKSLDTTCLAALKPTPFIYAMKLPNSDFKKYGGNYKNDDPGKKMRLYERQGMYYMEDENSVYAGDAQLLYKGNDTFGLVDCNPCKLIFEMEGNTVKKVTRAFREKVIFYPEE